MADLHWSFLPFKKRLQEWLTGEYTHLAISFLPFNPLFISLDPIGEDLKNYGCQFENHFFSGKI